MPVVLPYLQNSFPWESVLIGDYYVLAAIHPRPWAWFLAALQNQITLPQLPASKRK